MCNNPACGGHNKTLEELDDQMFQTVAKYGHQVIGVLGNERFSYSVGRCVKERPELVVTGPLPQGVALSMINRAAQFQDEGQPVADGHIFPADTLISGFAVKVVAVDPQRSQMFQAINLGERIGSDVEALQLVWPDMSGNWPDQPGYDRRFKQPIHALP